MRKKLWVALAFVGIAVAIAVHQYLTWGKLFEWSDLHHETFIVAFLFGAVVLWLI